MNLQKEFIEFHDNIRLDDENAFLRIYKSSVIDYFPSKSMPVRRDRCVLR